MHTGSIYTAQLFAGGYEVLWPGGSKKMAEFDVSDP